MSENTKSPRLDEILLKLKLVTPEQIQKALAEQKQHGEKLGFHLVKLGFIDESGLVKALAVHFNREGVVLTNLKISKAALELIPAKVALSRKVLPFIYIDRVKTLKVACVDPADESLQDELRFLVKGVNVRLFVAAESALDAAIRHHYGIGEDGDKDFVSGTSKIPIHNELLLVTDERYSGPLLKSLFEWDGFRVTITDSADDAIALIDEHHFHTVFIKDTVSGDYLDLIDRLRKISPRTVVRYFETTSSLLLNEGDLAQDSQLYYTNLDLFTSILSSQNKQMVNHSGRMGRYVSRLCDKLGLPHKERLAVSTAAYVHDLARFYYKDPKETDVRKQVAKTAKLLQSVNYPPVVVQMLLSMYKDLEGKYTKRLPIEILGGNILTVVDLFCSTISPEQKLSLDRFDVVKRKLHEMTGRLFLAEIVEAFIAMVQEQILDTAASGAMGQVMILSDNATQMQPVEMRLRNEGFRVVCETSIESFGEMFSRSEPDVLLMISTAKPEQITQTLDKVKKLKSSKAKIPIFLLVKEYYSAQLTAVLDKGVEDIISLDNNLDILVAKLRRIIAELNNKAAHGEGISDSVSATGRISNISLIDILQALGPGQKTARILVTSQDKSQKLEMYLDRGKIIYARLGDFMGAEAVYRGMNWSDGVWTIEPVPEEKLPQPNNTLPNESILMEGCRLIDERSRTGEVII